jgi:sucrose-phosphate synthase
VVELAKALSERSDVALVELFTRRIVDPEVDEEYAVVTETLNDKARIVRIECGQEGYLHKELLWDHLDSFADNLLDYFRQCECMPDVLHGHYADAGYVAMRLSHTTGIPVVFTGHSLGRDKQKRLMAAGMKPNELEQRYHIKRRIEAEEEVLATANLVITSTHQEISEQYEMYDYYNPGIMAVVPPGTDLKLFHPPELGEATPIIANSIRRFLDEPEKPIILALSRPDPRKNIAILLHAYGRSKALQENANLVIIAGNRGDIRKMDDGAQEVLTELLILVDYYDLYGKVAIPKKHVSTEVPAIYRMSASSRGVFVNPALTEPFGLTLLEAAASGLPFIATENGGPVDIVKNCKCGILVDPINADGIGEALKTLLLDEEAWRKHSANGLKNVARKYSWKSHARLYIDKIKPIIAAHEPIEYSPAIIKASRRVDRLIVTDLDKTLLSNPQGLKEFKSLIAAKRKECAFGIATARRLDSVLGVLKQFDLPRPDILISSLGTEIYYSNRLDLSTDWAQHVDHDWNPKAIRRILSGVKGLTGQDDANQSRFKISYHFNTQIEGALSKEEIVSLLRQEEQTVNIFLSSGQNLDITPARASKGLALRYVAQIWDIPMERILVAAGAGADEDMITGNVLSVIVKNRVHEPLEFSADKNIYFSQAANALGIIEATEHYRFFDDVSHERNNGR